MDLEENRLADAVLAHLQEVARAKRVAIEVAVAIAQEYPLEAADLVRSVKVLTRSADKLLGDTNVH